MECRYFHNPGDEGWGEMRHGNALLGEPCTPQQVQVYKCIEQTIRERAKISG